MIHKHFFIVCVFEYHRTKLSYWKSELIFCHSWSLTDKSMGKRKEDTEVVNTPWGDCPSRWCDVDFLSLPPYCFPLYLGILPLWGLAPVWADLRDLIGGIVKVGLYKPIYGLQECLSLPCISICGFRFHLWTTVGESILSGFAERDGNGLTL